jgi:hypothetical protein
MPRDHRHGLVDAPVADGRGHVGPFDEDVSALVERDRAFACKVAERRSFFKRDLLLEREPCERAVHRPGVEVTEAEPLCESSCNGALAGSRGAVDGDDQR